MTPVSVGEWSAKSGTRCGGIGVVGGCRPAAATAKNLGKAGIDAVVVIGGLVSSTILTLLVLPALYKWFSVNPNRIEHV